MEPIAKRLKSFLQHKGLTTTAFTRILQYSSCEKIARLFRVQGAKPSVDILEDIAKHFEELNLRWLITGHGEMLRGPSTTPATIVQETKTTAAIQQEHDPKLLFIHAAGNDAFPFMMQNTNHEPKPLLGSLINFIENVQEEQ